jgi:hypothetical protein
MDMAEQNKPGTSGTAQARDKADSASTPSAAEAKTEQRSEHRPEQKSAAKADAKPKATTPKRRLAPASESSEPAVHQLLAEQEIARLNGDEDEIKRTQDALADLGFE